MAAPVAAPVKAKTTRFENARSSSMNYQWGARLAALVTVALAATAFLHSSVQGNVSFHGHHVSYNALVTDAFVGAAVLGGMMTGFLATKSREKAKEAKRELKNAQWLNIGDVREADKEEKSNATLSKIALALLIGGVALTVLHTVSSLNLDPGSWSLPAGIAMMTVGAFGGAAALIRMFKDRGNLEQLLKDAKENPPAR